jgi:anti-anti-sigma factor
VDIDIIRTRDLAILTCRGRLVGDGAALVRDAAWRAFSAGQDVALDLWRVTQMDAHGAGVLAELFWFARREGRVLTLSRVNDRVRRVLQITGLDSVLSGVKDSDALADGAGSPSALLPAPGSEVLGLPGWP